MHLGWLVTTLGLLWDGRGRARAYSILSLPLCKGSQLLAAAERAWSERCRASRARGSRFCIDYSSVFDCEDSPEEANADYDPSSIALLL